jgi:hypothetical protein
VFRKHVALRTASLNSAANVVTITLAKPIKGALEVTVQRTVTSTAGESGSVTSTEVIT